MDRVSNNHSSDFISAGTEEGYYSARNLISSSKEHPATRSVSLPLSALNPHIVPFFFSFSPTLLLSPSPSCFPLCSYSSGLCRLF